MRPKKVRLARRRDHASHGALFGDCARIGVVADFLGDGQRFAGERRLIAAQIIAFNEQEIRGDDLARGDADNIARRQFGGGDRRPGAVAHHARAGREVFL